MNAVSNPTASGVTRAQHSPPQRPAWQRIKAAEPNIQCVPLVRFVLPDLIRHPIPAANPSPLRGKSGRTPRVRPRRVGGDGPQKPPSAPMSSRCKRRHNLFRNFSSVRQLPFGSASGGVQRPALYCHPYPPKSLREKDETRTWHLQHSDPRLFRHMRNGLSQQGACAGRM